MTINKTISLYANGHKVDLIELYLESSVDKNGDRDADTVWGYRIDNQYHLVCTETAGQALDYALADDKIKLV